MREQLYVPILKWKKGEQEALKSLTSDQKSKIVPLIEIINHEEPKEILECLETCFDKPVYMDTSIATQDDREFLTQILETSRDNNKTIFPVLYFDDFPETANIVSEIADRVAIRISIPENIDGPSYDEIFQTIKDFATDNFNLIIDIILDLGIVTDKNEANSQLRELRNVFQDFLINESYYNSIIISSTSFPENLSSISAGENASFIRYDIKIFNRILEKLKSKSLKEKLIYSDYGVTKFTDSEIDFSKMRYGILPKIKYTTNSNYVVLKGKKNHATKKMIKDYIDLSKEVYNSNYYFGEEFSFGDLEIKERAHENKGPGNGTNWVTTAANHHIAVVVEQLSKIV